MAQFDCMVCGREFKSYNQNAKYCSQTCKGTAYIKYQWKKCEHCGKEFKPRKASSKYCSLNAVISAGKIKLPINKRIA